jgi:DNA-binding MarR family transcriptional regulator
MTQQKNIFSFQNPDESPGYLLWQVSNLWQRKMNQALDTLDLTHVQFVLLAALYWLSMSNKSVTQIDIADHAKVDKMVTSNVLRTLQKKGLLTRAEHETDTRAKSVVMTAAGKKLLTEAIKLL